MTILRAVELVLYLGAGAPAGFVDGVFALGYDALELKLFCHPHEFRRLHIEGLGLNHRVLNLAQCFNEETAPLRDRQTNDVAAAVNEQIKGV